MVKYECYRCGYTNDNKSNIIRHINRKNTCKVNLLEIKLDDCKKDILNGISYKEYCEKIMSSKSKIMSSKMSSKSKKMSSICHQNVTKKENICNFCEKLLSSRQALWRHLKTCKEKQKDDTVRESMTELARLLNEKDKQIEKKEKEHQKQIELLIEKAGLATTNNITNNNNIQNNFKLLNYKETDTSHLTENDYVKCLEHYNFCVPHLIRKIHFNPKKPENHNIYIFQI